MIRREDLIEIGRFLQPHGIKGELNSEIEPGVDVCDLRCIVCQIEGIFVPFFIVGSRPRGLSAKLLTIEGISDEKEAALLQNKPIYALKDEVEITDESDSGDGFYAEDLIGFTIEDKDAGLKGKIIDVEDSTDNVLFVVDAGRQNHVLIPVADEFIETIDPSQKYIEISLPEGLLEL